MKLHVKDQDKAAAIAADLEKIAATRAEVDRLSAAFARLVETIATREKTAAALRQEAEDAKRDARDKMRAVVGIPTKAVRDAKARQLSALELADETLKIAEEERIQSQELHEQLFAAAKALAADQEAALSRYCDALAAEQIAQVVEQFPLLGVLAQIAPEASARALFDRATMAVDRRSGLHVAHLEKSRLRVALEASAKPPADGLLDDAMPALLDVPHVEAPAYLSRTSPVEARRQRAERAARYQELMDR